MVDEYVMEQGPHEVPVDIAVGLRDYGTECVCAYVCVCVGGVLGTCFCGWVYKQKQEK